jgi:CheY-like chemotaxis protein
MVSGISSDHTSQASLRVFSQKKHLESNGYPLLRTISQMKEYGPPSGLTMEGPWLLHGIHGSEVIYLDEYPQGGGFPMANISILEESPCVRELIFQELAGDGHHVDGFADPKSLIRFLRSSRPDLIILEPQLRDRDGWDLLRYIKKRFPDLPILLLSASKSLLDDPRASLADGSLKKGFDFSALKQAVTACLQGKQGIDRGTRRERLYSSRVALTTGY